MSALASIESTAGVIAPLIFNQVYPATVDHTPGAIFLVAAGRYCILPPVRASMPSRRRPLGLSLSALIPVLFLPKPDEQAAKGVEELSPLLAGVQALDLVV